MLGLPGNPVSALVCAHLFLRRRCRAHASASAGDPPARAAPASAPPLPANGPREHYMRARVVADADGWRCTPFAAPGQLASLGPRRGRTASSSARPMIRPGPPGTRLSSSASLNLGLYRQLILTQNGNGARTEAQRPIGLRHGHADAQAIRPARTSSTSACRRDGVPPSFDEMKEALDLRSKSGIHRLITALEERGFIRRLAAPRPRHRDRPPARDARRDGGVRLPARGDRRAASPHRAPPAPLPVDGRLRSSCR